MTDKKVQRIGKSIISTDDDEYQRARKQRNKIKSDTTTLETLERRVQVLEEIVNRLTNIQNTQ